MIYRTYDAQWNRTGYATEPQHKGQMPCSDGMDFPARCPACNGGIIGVGLPAWLRLRGIGPSSCHSGGGYVAWCKQGHRIEREQVA